MSELAFRIIFEDSAAGGARTAQSPASGPSPAAIPGAQSAPSPAPAPRPLAASAQAAGPSAGVGPAFRPIADVALQAAQHVPLLGSVVRELAGFGRLIERVLSVARQQQPEAGRPPGPPVQPAPAPAGAAPVQSAPPGPPPAPPVQPAPGPGLPAALPPPANYPAALRPGAPPPVLNVVRGGGPAVPLVPSLPGEAREEHGRSTGERGDQNRDKLVPGGRSGEQTGDYGGARETVRVERESQETPPSVPQWTVDQRHFQGARQAWSEGKATPPAAEPVRPPAPKIEPPPLPKPAAVPTPGPAPIPPLRPIPGAAAGAPPVAGGAAAGGAALAGVAVAAAAVAGALLVGAKAASAFKKSLDETTERLAPFSGAITAQKAENEVKRMLTDLQALQLKAGGRTNEENLRQFEEAKGEAGIAIQRAKDAVQAQLLEQALPIIQNGVDILTVISAGVQGAMEYFEQLPDWVKNVINPLSALGVKFDGLHDTAEAIRAKWEQESIESADPLYRQFGMLPDLSIDSPATAAAGLERKEVAFDFVGGEELP